MWSFNPPHASHFGGIFEILVKSTRGALRVPIVGANFNQEGFKPMVTENAWTLNQQLAQKIGNNEDRRTFTPDHSLEGPEETTSPPDISQARLDPRGRLRLQLEVPQHFPQLVRQQVVPFLAPGSRWLRETESLREGDVVIEIGNETTKGEWKFARITKIFPSTNDFTRRVEIIDSTNQTHICPINKLIPLLI